MRYIIALCTLLAGLIIIGENAHSANRVRIKDIVSVEGVRDNLLVGYGLVVGLNGSGDNLNNSAFTQKGLSDFLQRLGVNTKGATLKTKNIAAVTITGKLPPFARHGTYIDVQVSTLGDAKSLEGGTLLATPLLGADGEVYAVAQGQVALGGFRASDGSSNVPTKAIPTNGFVANGAIVEKEINFALNDMGQFNLSLHNPDFATADRIAITINRKLGMQAATASDPATISLSVPEHYRGNLVALLDEIEQLRVEPDQPAKVIIDEDSGIIVMGENVQISTVAVAQGNLLVKVDQKVASGLDPFATTLAVANAGTGTENRGEKMAIIGLEGSSLKDLVDGLNGLGVSPRDLISILESIKAAGALHAEIEVR